MAVSLDDSWRWCRRLTRRTAGNFGYSFLTLPRPQYDAMCALYAYMRVTDDLADDTSQPLSDRQASLKNWRREVLAALNGQIGGHPALPALAAITTQFGIPHNALTAVLDGMEFDLSPTPIHTFDDLSQYCYLVAGAVGICCIHIWGFKDPAALPLAIRCGRALQLTNILRDLAEDAAQDRFYLPANDLQQCGYSVADLKAGRSNQAFYELTALMAARTREDYRAAEGLFPLLNPAGRPILRIMLDIYGEIFDKLEQSGFNLSQGRVRLSRWRKLWLVGNGWWRPVAKFS